MDENLSRGYIALGKAHTSNDFRFTNGYSHLSPPVDKYNVIYLSLLLAGVGFLLPYNSFIIAGDYFIKQFPNSTIIFDMSFVYIIMAFFAVLANNILVETLSLNTRITFGYIISFVTLLFIAFFEIWLQVFDPNTSYNVLLASVAIVSLGCTVQQSSFYGYTSMLPSRYTQAVMAGESGAGFLVSINRIITKLLFEDRKNNTLIFFLLSSLGVGGCFFLHQVARKTDFVQFYITLCKESRRITLEPSEDATLMEQSSTEQGGQSQGGQASSRVRGAQQGGQGGATGLSFANPVYEPNVQPGPTYKVEDIVVNMRGRTSSIPLTANSSSRRLREAISRGIYTRWQVARHIWHYMSTIALAYFVTLCLYPGIVSEIPSCTYGNWMPVILMAGFNAADLIGKVLASMPRNWSKTRLMVLALSRLMLIPLFLGCALPRSGPFITGEDHALMLSMMLGFTNGVVGSVPMIVAPSKVSEEHRELTGNIMTLSYNIGLTGGSLVAYLLDDMIGPMPPTSPCQTNRSLLAPENYHESLKHLTKAVNATTATPTGITRSTTAGAGTTVATLVAGLATSTMTKLMALTSTLATTQVFNSTMAGIIINNSTSSFLSANNTQTPQVSFDNSIHL
uniref:Equilibrative nucleoside transporter 4 n=1 Tax=Cacopsylla melanoneura TaxID=428564 RepID=A0A8D8TT11_9HEMI